MSNLSDKINKKEAQPTDFEYQVAQALKEIEAASDLKSQMKDVKITGATEHEETFKGQKVSAVIIWLDYRSMTAVKSIHARLQSELEKRFRRSVALVFRRTIIPKYSKIKGQQKRPNSRTLTVVHEEIMKDLLFPHNFLGKRLRVKTNGKRVIRYILDPNDRDTLQDKVTTLTAIYKKLTGKDVVFEFPLSREFPV